MLNPLHSRLIRGKHLLASAGVLLGTVSLLQALKDRKTVDKGVSDLVCTPFIPEKLHILFVTSTLQL